MGIEEIVSRIKQEAHEQADKITAEARQRADAQRREFEKELEEKRRRLQKEMEAKIRSKADIIISEARRESRAELLKAKESLIQQAINTALEKLRSLPAEDYQRLLAGLVEKGKEQVGSPCLAAVSREEDASIIQGLDGVELLSERAQGTGGVVLFSSDRKLRVDYTFEGIAQRKRGELRTLAARLLFS